MNLDDKSIDDIINKFYSFFPAFDDIKIKYVFGAGVKQNID